MDIQHEIDQFVAAVGRLRGVTAYINGLADQVEGLVAESAPLAEPYVNQMPTAAAEYPAPPVPAPAFIPQDAPPVNPTTFPPAGQHFTGSSPTATAPNAPQEPAPAATQTTGVGAPGGAPVEGQGAPTAAPTAPAPAAPAAQTPWEAQAAESAATPAPAEAEPAKKPARRTNEELAAEAGVDLAEVKKWKGGGRISKKDIEEFALLKAGANFAAANPLPTGQLANPFAGTVPVPVPSPEQAPTIPPQHAPAAPQAAPAAPPADWAQAAQPAAAPPASPGEVYGDWPTVEGGFDASNPFGG